MMKSFIRPYGSLMDIMPFDVADCYGQEYPKGTINFNRRTLQVEFGKNATPEYIWYANTTWNYFLLRCYGN